MVSVRPMLIPGPRSLRRTTSLSTSEPRSVGLGLDQARGLVKLTGHLFDDRLWFENAACKSPSTTLFSPHICPKRTTDLDPFPCSPVRSLPDLDHCRELRSPELTDPPLSFAFVTALPTPDFDALEAAAKGPAPPPKKK